MTIKIIGIGAAGNKAAIRAVAAGVVEENDVLLLNTSTQDIDINYTRRSAIFAEKNSVGGCGKERSRSKELLLKALQNSDSITQDLNMLINPGDLPIIVASTEGGTGSGAAPVLAAYISDVIGVRPQLIGFAGTEDDLRGLQNTIDFFKDCATMCANCTIQIISNKKFVGDANGNKLKAEILANDEFVSRLRVLQGAIIRQSDQNIDQMDHLKIVTTPGYMSIMTYETQDSIESLTQFDSICAKMIDNSRSLPTSNAKITRLGVILTVTDYEKDNIDWQYGKIKNPFEEIGEVFTHVQSPINETRQVIIVEAGLEMPTDYIMSAYTKFKARSEKLNSNNSTNDFLKKIGGLQTSNSDGLDFDGAATTNTTKPSDFFSKITGKTETAGGFKNTSKDDVITKV